MQARGRSKRRGCSILLKLAYLDSFFAWRREILTAAMARGNSSPLPLLLHQRRLLGESQRVDDFVQIAVQHRFQQPVAAVAQPS